MRELSSVVLEMERQGKSLGKLLRVGRLNTMSWKEFQKLVALVERLQVNLTDFNVLHFRPVNLESKRTRKVKRHDD